jgi:hypothetical protein
VFLGSYLPLSLILLAQDFDYSSVARPLCWNFFVPNSGCSLPFRNPVYSIGIFAVCVACFVITLGALSVVRAKREIAIREAKYLPAELMNYTLPYVVSFMSIDYQETGKFIGLLIFLAWMFWIVYRSGQLVLNPVLIAFGWRLYEIAYSYPGDDKLYNGLALSGFPIEGGERYRHTAIQDVLIIKKQTEQDHARA